MKRRSFLKGVLGSAAALVAGSSVIPDTSWQNMLKSIIRTQTGRLSCSQPNLQVIPRLYGPRSWAHLQLMAPIVEKHGVVFHTMEMSPDHIQRRMAEIFSG